MAGTTNKAGKATGEVKEQTGQQQLGAARQLEMLGVPPTEERVKEVAAAMNDPVQLKEYQDNGAAVRQAKLFGLDGTKEQVEALKNPQIQEQLKQALGEERADQLQGAPDKGAGGGLESLLDKVDIPLDKGATFDPLAGLIEHADSKGSSPFDIGKAIEGAKNGTMLPGPQPGGTQPGGSGPGSGSGAGGGGTTPGGTSRSSDPKPQSEKFEPHDQTKPSGGTTGGGTGSGTSSGSTGPKGELTGTKTVVEQAVEGRGEKGTKTVTEEYTDKDGNKTYVTTTTYEGGDDSGWTETGKTTSTGMTDGETVETVTRPAMYAEDVRDPLLERGWATNPVDPADPDGTGTGPIDGDGDGAPDVRDLGWSKVAYVNPDELPNVASGTGPSHARNPDEISKPVEGSGYDGPVEIVPDYSEGSHRGPVGGGPQGTGDGKGDGIYTSSSGTPIPKDGGTIRGSEAPDAPVGGESVPAAPAAPAAVEQAPPAAVVEEAPPAVVEHAAPTIDTGGDFQPAPAGEPGGADFDAGATGDADGDGVPDNQ